MSVSQKAQAGPRPPQSLLELLGMLLKQAPRNFLRQLPWMVLVSLFTWVYHTFLLVYVNEGFDTSGSSVWIKTAVSGYRSPSGIVFWTAMGGIASLAFNQLKQNGLGKTVSSFASAPGWMAKSLRPFTSGALTPLLVSLAAGLLVLSFFARGPLYAIQFGLLILGDWIAQGRGLLGMVIPLGWSDVQRLLKRGGNTAPFQASWMAWIVAGLSVSALLGIIFPTWFMLFSLVGTIGLMVLLLVTRSGKKPSRGTVVLLALLIASGWLAVHKGGVVLADDGGWQEAGGTFSSWIASEGAMKALGMGIPPSLGAALGWLFGSLFGGIMGISFPGFAAPLAGVQPPSSSAPGWITDPEVSNAINAWQKHMDDALAEAEKYRQQWEEAKGSYDVNDPNYKNLKDQYDRYIDYQNQQAKQAQDQIDDLINTESRYQQEEKYRQAYEQHRAENGAWIDQQRQNLESRNTAFDREMDKLVGDNKEKAEQLKHLQSIRREATNRSQKAEGATGASDPLFDAAGRKADELIDKIMDGKNVTQQDIDRVGQVIKDRVMGRTKTQGEETPTSNMDILSDTVTGSVRTAFTSTNPDGSTNLAAIFTRIGLGIGTAGTSEWVYTPVNMGYNAKDAIDRGASDSSALGQAVGQAAFEYLLGKGIQGGMWVTGKTLSLIGKGLKHVMPGTSRAVTGFVSNAADKISKFFKGAPAPKPIPTARLDSVNRALQSALKKGDEKAIMNLYKNGGMKDLSKLEQLGHITPAEAKQLNAILSKNVSQAIDKGTVNSIRTFEKNTGVKVNRVNIGDSGSSAKGGGTRSVKTDFDRTSVPEFDKKSVESFAARKGITPAEAERQLKKEFSKTHFNEVDQSLRDSGMPGGANDVDYKTYDGIGSGAGNSDAYSYGFTTQRQAVGGKTKVFVPDKAGGARSYETSGQALVDADGLQKIRTGGGIPGEPNKIVPKELPSVISQQAQSAASHNDVKSLAKALGRTEKAAQGLQINNPAMDNLSQLGKQLRDNPQKTNEILKGAGMTEKEFVEKARSAINEVNGAAGSLKNTVEGNLGQEVNSMADVLGRMQNSSGGMPVGRSAADQLNSLGQQIRDNPMNAKEILDSAGMTESEFVERASGLIGKANDVVID